VKVQTLASLQNCVSIHTAKTLEAIESTYKLFALPFPFIRHSPIVVCSLALTIMAQVSAYNHLAQKGNNDYMVQRDQVRLGLGVLRVHERYWGLAKRSMGEMKHIAKQMLLGPVPGGIESRYSSDDSAAYSLTGAINIEVDGLIEDQIQPQDFQLEDLDMSAFEV
jgi:hypothetical protein